jgi:1,4-dihydroxy-2-naphthoate octaprenyltransferase
MLRNLLAITRANFLPLTVVIVLSGLCAAWYSHAAFNALNAILVLIGALLTHASVNAFNNYFDYRSHIDERTMKTPFSGGVDVIVSGQTQPTAAFFVALACLVGAGVIGIYFLIQMFFPLMPLILYGAFVIVFYTPLISRMHALSEIIAGSGFGLIGLGTYVTQAGVIDSACLAIFVPITILVALLLFLNEFPDADVDKLAGRRHTVILIGKRRSSWLYAFLLGATYGSIILSVITGAAPLPALIALLTIPMACRAARIVIRNYEKIPELLPALALNVILILSTICLLSLAFLSAAFFHGSFGF